MSNALEIQNDNMEKLSSEKKAFLEQLLTKEQFALANILRSRLGGLYEDLKDECVSDICWLAIDKIDVLMNCQYPGKWLAASTKYIALKAKRERYTQFNHTSIKDIADVAFPEDVFEMALYNIWLEQDAYNILKKELTKRELEVFELMVEQQKPHEEIARELNMTESTVRNIKKNIKDKYRYAIRHKLF